ncbi:hypothetical protein TcasGA2_TC004815 [Tribolium castaneum]|uniref:Uncharacterized protein n=1 Tax=Tribolium castaneum TaxID=7070 RepID=D6WB66_TRICA|nr:hypothetical protein TcasGA2_TC004815 [Tribolium castaneum]
MRARGVRKIIAPLRNAISDFRSPSYENKTKNLKNKIARRSGAVAFGCGCNGSIFAIQGQRLKVSSRFLVNVLCWADGSPSRPPRRNRSYTHTPPLHKNYAITSRSYAFTIVKTIPATDAPAGTELGQCIEVVAFSSL